MGEEENREEMAKDHSLPLLFFFSLCFLCVSAVNWEICYQSLVLN